MKKILSILIFTLFFTATAFATSSINNQLSANCPNSAFVNNCSGCHNDSAAFSAGLNSDWSFFCSQVDPNDVDDDGDGLSENQGDCNDSNATIFPGAVEICGDGIDQDCNGMDLSCPPTPSCMDADNDGYSAMTPGLDCGPVDCNDNDPAINPGAAERCADGVDNNCDGLADGQDTVICPAPPTCTDADGDGFFAEMGCNTAVDCNDRDGMIYPGATELCGDRLDNDCDNSIDEGCDMGGNDDGPTLYEMNCASCHQMLSNSDVCGDDAEEIMEAIAEDEGGMSFLSLLSDAQIKAIAEALENCREDDQPEMDSDDDSDEEDGRPEMDSDDEEERERKPRRSWKKRSWRD